MIRFTKGNLLESGAEALVNTVNTVGVMGKGIALQFKHAFPFNYKKYREACKKGELVTGKLLVVKDSSLLTGEKTIINFPTKRDWRNPAKNEYIASGLIELLSYLKQSKLNSIALPALGCGNGGLDWQVIKPMLTGILSELTIEIIVYEPA
ncbi:macro domain-containing protein [Mucilaginibacter sp. BJC16-A38]|uniref:macro domain-containing protein n=1 Tax=Mucilaginibacter phenanthrenivorans TaxID=1234842 RepID=UPI002158003B|nr:macro domain-containing protein [Mucilaginibacter phenanthrenivorans]MCR8560314.1 macro domain-containing protein [Mucilaginibacter phenanthrenivorans]